jgi:hypothetical protein
MAKAWLIVLLLRGDAKLQKRFIRHAKLKKSNRDRIATEVMAYVMGVKTEPARKLAWKRGRVLEFLHEQGVKSGKIASEIKTRGGIEAIYKHAAKLTPRRDPKSAKTKPSEKKSKVLGKNGAGTNRQTAADDADPPSVRSSERLRTNDQQVAMQILINLSDREAIEEMPTDSQAKFTVKKINQKGAQIEVIRLKKLPTETETTSNDW